MSYINDFIYTFVIYTHSSSLFVSVDGQWSDWEEWGICSKTCEKGTQLRARLCNKPVPQFEGKNCVGLGSEEIDCNDILCPSEYHFSFAVYA